MNNPGKGFLFFFSFLHYNSSSTNAYIIFFPFCLSFTANMDFYKGSGWCCNLFWSLLFSFSEKKLWCFPSQISFFSPCKSRSKHYSHMEEKNLTRGESIAYMLLLNVHLYVNKMTISEIQKIDLYLLKFVMCGLFYELKKMTLSRF